MSFCLFQNNSYHNSTFLYNAAVKGGPIYIDETGTTLYSNNSHPDGNDNELQNILASKSHNQIKNAKELNEIQKGIGNSSNVETAKLIISHCVFINGTSPLTEGGVLYIIGSSMEIIFTQLNFILNDCGLGKCGVLCSWGIGDTMPRITIQDCHFENNRATINADLFFQRMVVNIVKSSFLWNTGLCCGGAIVAEEFSMVTIYQCIFEGDLTFSSYINVQKSVNLHITDSQFPGIPEVWSPFSGIYIVATEKSVVTVTHSQFSIDSEFVLLSTSFYISDTSTLRVLNCTFHSKGTIGLTIITASNHAEAKFINCSFVKVSGLTVSNNAHVSFINSSISQCSQTALQNAFIEVSKGGKFDLIDTNITGNIFLENKGFILAETNGSLQLSSCFMPKII